MHVFALVLVLLHGVVRQGPTQPVCQVGVPCSKPAANVELLFARANGTRTKVRTDAKGRYSVQLARGTYTVTIVPPRRIGTGIRPATITTHGSRQRLDFDLDTGIR